MDSPLVTTPLLGLVLTAFLHLIGLKLFPRLKLLDFPERYNILRKRLPYPTGVLAVFSFLALFPLLFEWNRQAVGLLSAVILLGGVSFVDDRKPLPAIVRLFVQFFVAALIFATGDCTGSRVCSVTNPLEGWIGGPIIELNGGFPVVSFAVTVIWLMLTTNALNWFDGIPGQVNTLSTIGFVTIGFLSLSDRVGQPELALLAFTLAGMSAGSLLFDLPPPMVVPGDSGAMFFGLMLGVLTVFSGGKVATAFLVLGVPIIDLLFVITRRIRCGRSPFSGSMSGEHLHHRLLARGWSQRGVIFLTSLIGALFGITALFLDTRGKMLAALLLFFVMLLLSRYADRPAAKDAGR